LNDGRVLVYGGTGSCGASNIPEIYDPSADVWTVMTKGNQRRYAHTVSVLSDGTALVTGGEAGISCLDAAEIYHP